MIPSKQDICWLRVGNVSKYSRMKPFWAVQNADDAYFQSLVLFCPGLASSSTVRVFALRTRRGRRSCTTSRTRSTSPSSPLSRVDLTTMPLLVWLWHLGRWAQHTNLDKKWTLFVLMQHFISRSAISSEEVDDLNQILQWNKILPLRCFGATWLRNFSPSYCGHQLHLTLVCNAQRDQYWHLIFIMKGQIVQTKCFQPTQPTGRQCFMSTTQCMFMY